MFEIKKTDGDKRKTINVLVYGEPGVGKTTFSATAPKPLILDVEAGILSLASKSVDFVRIEKSSDVLDVYNMLKTSKHDYQTVVIDSLTEYQRKVMDTILLKSGRERATIGDWGMCIEETRRLVRNFRDLELNLILVLAAAEIKDEERGMLMKRPALSGRILPEEVMGYVDIVAYQFVKEMEVEKGVSKTVRKLLCNPTEKVYAKDRSGKLGKFEEPDFEILLSKIFA